MDLYRGLVQHTNSYYTGQVIIMLNVLVGNARWTGGMGLGGSHWHEDGNKKRQPFIIVKGLHPGKLSSFGVTSSNGSVGKSLDTGLLAVALHRRDTQGGASLISISPAPAS